MNATYYNSMRNYFAAPHGTFMCVQLQQLFDALYNDKIALENIKADERSNKYNRLFNRNLGLKDYCGIYNIDPDYVIPDFRNIFPEVFDNYFEFDFSTNDYYLRNTNTWGYLNKRKLVDTLLDEVKYEPISTLENNYYI